MKLYGPAGNLEIRIKGVTVRKDLLILNAEMGVWQNTLLMDSSDIRLLVPMFFRFSVLLFIIKSYIRSIFGKDKNSKT